MRPLAGVLALAGHDVHAGHVRQRRAVAHLRPGLRDPRIRVETQTFVVSANMFQPAATGSGRLSVQGAREFFLRRRRSAIVDPFGMYLVQPTIGRATIVYADLHMEDRIVADVFDPIGHYARWDVVSARPARARLVAGHRRAARAAPPPERLEELAVKYGMRRELLDALVKALPAHKPRRTLHADHPSRYPGRPVQENAR